MAICSPYVSSVEGTKTGTGNTALTSTSTPVRSVLVLPLLTNTDTVSVGFQDDPQGYAPISFGPYDDKWIDLADIVIKPTVAGEGVRYIALR